MPKNKAKGACPSRGHVSIRHQRDPRDPLDLQPLLSALKNVGRFQNVIVWIDGKWVLDAPLQITCALPGSVIFSPGSVRFTKNTDIQMIGVETSTPCSHAIVPFATHMNKDACAKMKSRIGTRPETAIIWICIGLSSMHSEKVHIAPDISVDLHDTFHVPLFTDSKITVELTVPVTFYISSQLTDATFTAQEGTLMQEIRVHTSNSTMSPAKFLDLQQEEVPSVDCIDGTRSAMFTVCRGTRLILFKPRLKDDDVIDFMPCVVLLVTSYSIHAWTASGTMISIALGQDRPPFRVTPQIPCFAKEWTTSYCQQGFNFEQTF